MLRSITDTGQEVTKYVSKSIFQTKSLQIFKSEHKIHQRVSNTEHGNSKNAIFNL